MPHTKQRNTRNRLILSLVLGLFGLGAIVLLSVNVASDLKLLRSASSDNMQWTLSQTEVEFLEFEITLEASTRAETPDLGKLRREFDIFYSRIATLGEASIYAPVRDIPQFSTNLRVLQDYLNTTATTIDAEDAALIAALPRLAEDAARVRTNVRRLSNAGLTHFATESDKRRESIFDTLSRLAIGVTLLTLALLLLALYLGKLNRQNIRRRSEVIQASKRMNVVTGTALDAVVVCDTDGVVLDFNAAAEQIFGYPAKEAIGQELGALIVPDHHRAAHDAGMQRMRDSGEKRVVGKGRIKLEAKRANGDLFPVEFAIQSAETDEGEIFISFLRDISHRVAAEQDLIKARDRALAGEKAKADFLATMSHEIRTPLNGLLGNLTLMHDTDLSQKQAGYVRNMETSGKLLMSHISDVLDITKYDAGKLTLRPVTMNISTLLQDIVDSQSGSALAQNTTLDWQWTGPPTDWISADKDRIQHILMNIIGNAVKFTKDGKVGVKVRVAQDDALPPRLQIAVTDTGIGMDETLKSQIFDDFMTGDVSYDRTVGGTGLGLGIAKRFVTALGGTIDVQSAPDKGSTFTVDFPIKISAPPAPQDDTRTRKTGANNLRVLLVEDNEINRVVAREMLKADGHSVSEAHNGQEAVDMVAAQPFDLVLMDISMPVMDGRTATRHIRGAGGHSADVPIVALTANAVAEEQQAFLSDGMNDVLTKPLSREGLLDLLAKYAAGGSAPETHAPQAPKRENQHLKELREVLGDAALQPLITRFHAEVDETLRYLDGPDAHDLTHVAERAHKMAGSAASLGAGDIRQAFIRVENAAKAADADALKAATEALPKVWRDVRDQISIE